MRTNLMIMLSFLLSCLALFSSVQSRSILRDQRTDQPIDQSKNQPIKLSVIESNDPSIDQSNNQLAVILIEPTDPSIDQTVEESAILDQPVEQSNNQLIDQLNNQLVELPIDRLVGEAIIIVEETINQPNDQSIDQSIKQTKEMDCEDDIHQRNKVYGQTEKLSTLDIPGPKVIQAKVSRRHSMQQLVNWMIQSIEQSIDESVNQINDKSIDQPILHSNDQSTDQSIKKLMFQSYQSNDQPNNQCPSVDSPYTLSSMPETVAASKYHTGSYRISPCRSLRNQCGPFVDQSACLQVNQQLSPTSFQTQTIWIGLGSSDTSSWLSINGDWINGAESMNTDLSLSNSSFCDSSTSQSIVLYKCEYGNDLITVISEPQYPTDPCTFILEVDSSIVCAAENSSSSSSSSISVNQSIVYGSIGVGVLAAILIMLGCYIHRRKVNRANNQAMNASLLGNQSHAVPAQHVMAVSSPGFVYAQQPINQSMYHPSNPYQPMNQPVYVQPMYQPNPSAYHYHQ